MSTRLDRLFLLLDTGGSSITRKAAAQQLGEVVRLHPYKLEFLLDRLHSYITSKSWETRIAAGQAVEAILKNFKWNPVPMIGDDDSIYKSSSIELGQLSLESFSLKKVLENGSYLLGGDERQFELEDENTKLDPKVRAARQRLLVNKRLGLDIANAIGIDTQDIFSNNDLLYSGSVKKPEKVVSSSSIVDIVHSEIRVIGPKMSSRERNRAKRKAKIVSRQVSSEKSVSEGNDYKRQKVSNFQRTNGSDDEADALIIAEPHDKFSSWPLAEFSEHLCLDLFSCSWETRHGAATALREVIRIQGKFAGMEDAMTEEQMRKSHQCWLEDKAVRLACVLALDRFGDFISDQVVAPVRETCAQVLGGILMHVPPNTVYSLVTLLRQMLECSNWATRHGGLLGMKYLLAVRPDIRKKLLEDSYLYIYKGLQDEMDDVVAVSAACLVPFADDLVECFCTSVVHELVHALWESLLSIDDLTSSTNSILNLIAKLVAHPKIIDEDLKLSMLVPRLWPFLYHASSSVRASTLQTLATLTNLCSTLQMENSISCIFSSESSSQCTKVENSTRQWFNPSLNCDNNINIEKLENGPIKKEIDNNDFSSSLSNFANDEPLRKDSPNPIVGLSKNADINSFITNTEDDLKNVEVKPISWLESILEPFLMHIYQRALLESKQENLDIIKQIWDGTLDKVRLSMLLLIICPLIRLWLHLLMSNHKVSIDSNLISVAHHHRNDGHKKIHDKPEDLGESLEATDSKFYIGGTRGLFDDSQSISQVIRSRCAASSMLGNLSHYVSQPMPGIEYAQNETPILCYVRLLISHLESRSYMHRYCSALVTREWARKHPMTQIHPLLRQCLVKCLTEVVYYDEITWAFTKLQQECRDFIAMMKHYNLDVDSVFPPTSIFSLGQMNNLSGPISESLLKSLKLPKKVEETLDSRRKALQHSVIETTRDQTRMSISVQASLAGALVCFKSLPDKLNPVVKPLMESIKNEENIDLQKMSANDLSQLVDLCIDRDPCPNNKIIKNLASFVCVDENKTPNILNVNDNNQLTEGIITLSEQHKSSEVHLLRRLSSSGCKGPGRPPGRTQNSPCVLECKDVFKSELNSQCQNEIQYRGCILALQAICKHFGPNLEAKLPQIIYSIFGPFENQQTKEVNVKEAQEDINWLQFIEIVIPVLDENILKKFDSFLYTLTNWLYHPYKAVRHLASRVVGALANSQCLAVEFFIENVLPSIGDMAYDCKRQGIVECIHFLIEKMGINIVPYIVLLIVPLLGRMSDPNYSVRMLATQCFATLVRLFPLETVTRLPSKNCEMSMKLVNKCVIERAFLDQLLDPTKIQMYEVPVPIKTELRSYQQNGVNWLAFLNRSKIHGILCDDMGLGKTLQSICILAGDHYWKEQDIKTGKVVLDPSKYPCETGVQSLVICPPTLTGHWFDEVMKFVDSKYLNPLHYNGLPVERKRLRIFFKQHNLIIASYKIVRNEIDFFASIKWNYIILDEGHIIKNSKTKSTIAIKELVGNHRLILSGTPIQNNVLELWSLFDFLMPGFLSTEKQFMIRYARPILQSRDSKSSSTDQEAGALAMEALHRQTLPFLLRRVKEDVLKDLPPKITQDYYCELSPMQQRLYEDFSRTKTGLSIDQTFNINNETPKSGGHIFQALQYLRRVYNHPKLVLQPSHPQYDEIINGLDGRASINDIENAAKLPALKQLLLDCGIGMESCNQGLSDVLTAVSPHRALVFCQLKAMLDIIEKDLLNVHLPTVTYLRLDGSVPSGHRQSLVNRFNSDPSIDLLLLTTHVGGLGLNLTGADTVIFVEHDWNPMRDLQAMDRAHRIGQKRVVNVYRLITKGTLEEKIMSLQKFKLMTANSVISHENSSLLSMGTDQLLDLFSSPTSSTQSGEKTDGNASSGLGVGGSKTILDSLPDLWDEKQYEEEYNLEAFLRNLKE